VGYTSFDTFEFANSIRPLHRHTPLRPRTGPSTVHKLVSPISVQFALVAQLCGQAPAPGICELGPCRSAPPGVLWRAHQKVSSASCMFGVDSGEQNSYSFGESVERRVCAADLASESV
jgi:hypothetical protein